MTTMICARCATEFERNIMRYKQTYCSRDCHQQSRKEGIKNNKNEVNCLTCNKKFNKNNKEIKSSPNHYCSRGCAAITNNKGKQRHKPKERICSCGKKFTTGLKHTSAILCPACKKERKENRYSIANTLGSYRGRESVNGKHPSWLNTHIRGFTRRMYKDIANDKCFNCGYSKHIEIAHIKPVSKFPDESTVGEVNARENILGLCPNCHWEFDHNMLSLDDIKKSIYYKSP